jgi:hypothetical protein
MTDQPRKAIPIDVPDPAKIEERGISIKAPAPGDFSIPDPWTPSVNGVPEADGQAAAQQDAAASGDSE